MDETALLERWENEARQPFQGWDFSYLEGRYHSEVPPWSIEQKVRNLIHDVDSSYDAREIARVLHDGGIFCTQQVDGRNIFVL
jgi:hypothetical protein